ncbi:MAG TPA: DHHA1 domain-containing protein, partial [Anaerolineales bacterium]
NAAALASTTPDELPLRVESMLAELAALRKENAALRTQIALSSFDALLGNVEMVKDIRLLSASLPDADMETLRRLADRFREKYPARAGALLSSGSSALAVLTEDLVKQGMKAGDLITSAGGRGGGRPNMAQGSLPEGMDSAQALPALRKYLEGKLK